MAALTPSRHLAGSRVLRRLFVPLTLVSAVWGASCATAHGLGSNRAGASNAVFIQPLRAVAPTDSVQPLATHRLSPDDRRIVFNKVWKIIRDRYYDPRFNGVDWDDIYQRYLPRVDASTSDQEFYALMSELTGELRDAHTRFSSPEQWKSFKKQQGITPGFAVDQVQGQTVVTSVVPDSTAARAGMQPGMVVLALDGEPVEARLAEILRTPFFSSSEQATHLLLYRKLLAGPRGSTLRVRLQREDGSVFEPVITRQVYSDLADVFTYVLPSGNLYLRFDGFQRSVSKQFREVLKKHRNSPGVIIDLRRNGGGELLALLSIAGYFFNQKTLFVKDTTRSGKPLSEFAGLWKLPLQLYVGKRGRQLYSGPVAILVDARSASSSELFAAGMQETHRATIIGTQSCGCVLGITKPRTMRGGSVLEVSEVLWFTPQGRKLEGAGVTPDRIVNLSLFDLQRRRDAVLAEADKTLAQMEALVARP